MQQQLTTYLYKIYGLNISSEIIAPKYLPNTIDINHTPDVYVKYGKIGDYLATKNYRELAAARPFCQNIENKFLYAIKPVADCLVFSGNTIIIDPYTNFNFTNLQLLLYGHVLGCLLQQRGLFVLHGCGVLHNDGIYIFIGNCGVGKSTLAAVFAKAGYKIICDDICALKITADSAPIAFPGLPYIKLHENAAKNLKLEMPDIDRVSSHIKKYYLPLSEHFCSKTLPVKYIGVLDYWAEETFSETPLLALEKLAYLKANSYRYEFLKPLNLLVEHLEQCKQIISHVPISIIKRPQEKFLLQELIDFIAEKIMR